MLETVDLKRKVDKAAYKEEIETLKARLGVLQQEVKQAGLPVIILFEGWGAAGKGSVLSDVILALDPRGFKTYSITEPSEDELRKPIMWRYWTKIPLYGQFSIFDRSWYQEVTNYRLEGKVSAKEVKRRLHNINVFERQLVDDGYLILKFFLHVSQKEQKKRFEKLESSLNTAWRVTKKNWEQNKHYDEYLDVYEEALSATHTKEAPWNIIASEDQNSQHLDIYRTIVQSIESALQAKQDGSLRKIGPGSWDGHYPQMRTIEPESFKMLDMPLLADVPLDKTLEQDEYKEELKKARRRLRKLHNELYRAKRPVIIAYEGWDAAGKGGNIKRVASGLDPRGYEVNPIASPTPDELHHQYLWRFWNRLPRTGHIGIFDRTWYGRVMVERLEGFATEEQWKRAYQEMNEFEKELSEWGAIILKFWVHIDKDEQLRRFQDRQNTPEKQWKITDEDWRNREKWDLYEGAVNDMLQKTSTEFAPWYIIQSQDKKYARIQAMNILIERIEKELDK